MNYQDYHILVISEVVSDNLIDFDLHYVNKTSAAIEYNSLYDYKIDLVVDLLTNKIGYDLFSLKKIGVDISLDKQVKIYLDKSVNNEVNKTIALSYLDNNERIYYNFVKRFINEYSDYDKIIEEVVLSKDFVKLREMIHQYKGFTLYLGSTRLFELTKSIELEIVENRVEMNKVEYFIYYHKRILKYARKIVENV